MGRGRLEGFSDGVMAVAITLLAFNLHAGIRSSVPLAEQFRAQWPSFAAYVLSFFLIGVIWLNHHYLFGLTTVIDRRLWLYNLVLLLFIATIPYATATYADYATAGGADARTAVLVYGGVMEGMAIARFLIPLHILRAGLNHKPISPREGRKLLSRYGLAVGAFPAITVMALSISAPTMLALHALLIGYYLGPAVLPLKERC